MRLPPIIESHSQAPVNSTTCRDLETALTELIVHRRGGGGSELGERYVTVGGGGVWPSVMKRYEGVGGCQMYGQKALRNT